MTIPQSVSAQDTLATHFRQINARLASLERAASTGAGVTDHGALTGLADNDHPQYQLAAALGSLAFLSTISSAEITNLTIQNGDIAAGTIQNSKLADITGPLFKGRDNATLGNVEDLTPTEATAMLNVFTTVLKGLVPSGGAASKYLRGDATWSDVGKLLVLSGLAAATATLSSVTTSAQDIVGATSGALALKASDSVFVDGVFDMISAANVTNIGTLDINGAEQSAQCLFKSTSATDRETVPQHWLYTVPSDGNYTFKLRGRVNSGTVGSFGVQHTLIRWQVFR